MIKISSFMTSAEAAAVSEALKGRGIEFFISTKGNAENYQDPYYQISVKPGDYLVVKSVVARVQANALQDAQRCPGCKGRNYKVIPSRNWIQRLFYWGTTRVQCTRCKMKFFI